MGDLSSLSRAYWEESDLSRVLNRCVFLLKRSLWKQEQGSAVDSNEVAESRRQLHVILQKLGLELTEVPNPAPPTDPAATAAEVSPAILDHLTERVGDQSVSLNSDDLYLLDRIAATVAAERSRLYAALARH